MSSSTTVQSSQSVITFLPPGLVWSGLVWSGLVWSGLVRTNHQSVSPSDDIQLYSTPPSLCIYGYEGYGVLMGLSVSSSSYHNISDFSSELHQTKDLSLKFL